MAFESQLTKKMANECLKIAILLGSRCRFFYRTEGERIELKTFCKYSCKSILQISPGMANLKEEMH